MISPPWIPLQNLKAVKLLGRGAKGVVFHVILNTTNLALKAFSRSSMQFSSMQNNVKNAAIDPYRRILFERDALLELDHPLLPSLHGFVSTDSVVGFLIDFCGGGDLSSLRRRQTEMMFSEDVIRFYAAELVLVLEYLHGLGFVYRDLKPENVLIQNNGHIMLVDFDLSTKLPVAGVAADVPCPDKIPKKKPKRGFSRLRRLFSCSVNISPELGNVSPEETAPRGGAARISPGSSSSSSLSTEKSNSFVGTEEYVAPEIINGSGHDFAVDWWGLGVVLYEMLYGRTPFRGNNRKETFYRILEAEPELTGERNSIRDLIGRLLEKDPRERIGGEEVKRHEFFRGVDWESVLEIGRPPYIPTVELEEEGKEEGTGIDIEKVVEEVILAKEKKKEGKFSSF